jgi:hypothetical protein
MVRFEWYSSYQQILEKIKKVIGTETLVLLCYPDFIKLNPYHVLKDVSDKELRAVIMQDKKPITFYSRKLNTAQKRYTSTDKELLSAIETF